MNFKSIISFALICLSQTLVVSAQERIFPYPDPPEELVTLQERTSYIINHFWERCDLQATILRRADFKAAFTDFVSFMPYADAEAVHSAIDRLVTAFAKKPDNLLTLAEIAEETLYNDDAELLSDEAYLPFAKAVAANKKISSARKARFAQQAKVLELTQVGSQAPDIEYIRPDGSKGRLSEITGKHILLFFNDPDCDECVLARVRLSADPNINDLIDTGLLAVVSIYPDEPSDDWRNAVAAYNQRWIVGASTNVDDSYDLRQPPVLYYLDREGKILSKRLLVENLLQAFKVANDKVNRKP